MTTPVSMWVTVNGLRCQIRSIDNQLKTCTSGQRASLTSQRASLVTQIQNYRKIHTFRHHGKT